MDAIEVLILIVIMFSASLLSNILFHGLIEKYERPIKLSSKTVKKKSIKKKVIKIGSKS